MAIVTTPTQPQLILKVGFDMKITIDHHPPPPHELNVINISSVPDPILTKHERQGCGINKSNNNNNMNDNNNNIKNNQGNISFITHPILTKLLMEGF